MSAIWLVSLLGLFLGFALLVAIAALGRWPPLRVVGAGSAILSLCFTATIWGAYAVARAHQTPSLARAGAEAGEFLVAVLLTVVLGGGSALVGVISIIRALRSRRAEVPDDRISGGSDSRSR